MANETDRATGSPFEPGTQDLLDDVGTRALSISTPAQLEQAAYLRSIAISAKRLADSLERVEVTGPAAELDEITRKWRAVNGVKDGC